MRQIAIIGLGESDREAPYGDWECWGFPWHPLAWHCDRLFEIHPIKDALEEHGSDYWGRLNEMGFSCPVYLQEACFQGSVRYPLEAVSALVEDYFGSSIAYPLALAIYEQVDRIGLWGIDLSEDIYDHQRPNIEYLIGFARGRGIPVDIAGEGKLFTLKRDFNDKRDIHYPQRYGWAA